MDNWPAYYYGPNGAAKVFTKENDVPAGWQDHPAKVKDAVKSIAPEPQKTAKDEAEKPSESITPKKRGRPAKAKKTAPLDL